MEVGSGMLAGEKGDLPTFNPWVSSDRNSDWFLHFLFLLHNANPRFIFPPKHPQRANNADVPSIDLAVAAIGRLGRRRGVGHAWQRHAERLA
jgi:hypothetical protein